MFFIGAGRTLLTLLPPSISLKLNLNCEQGVIEYKLGNAKKLILLNPSYGSFSNFNFV